MTSLMVASFLRFSGFRVSVRLVLFLKGLVPCPPHEPQPSEQSEKQDLAIKKADTFVLVKHIEQVEALITTAI